MLEDLGLQPRYELLVRESSLVEELLHQLVTALGHQFDQLLPVLPATVRIVVRDVSHREFSAAVTLVDVGLHARQVRHAPEVLFRPDWDLDRDTCSSEIFLDRRQRFGEAGPVPVAPVDEDEARHLEFIAELPYLFRLHLCAGNTVDDDDSRVRNTQGCAGLLDHVPEAGRIEHVDLVLLPFAERQLGRNRHLAFDFFLVVVRRRVPIVDAAEPGRRAAGVEGRRNKRRLPRTSVSHKTDVSDRMAIVDVHELLLGYSACGARKFGRCRQSPTLDLCRKRLL